MLTRPGDRTTPAGPPGARSVRHGRSIRCLFLRMSLRRLVPAYARAVIAITTMACIQATLHGIKKVGADVEHVEAEGVLGALLLMPRSMDLMASRIAISTGAGTGMPVTCTCSLRALEKYCAELRDDLPLPCGALHR